MKNRRKLIPVSIALCLMGASLASTDLSGIRNVDILKLLAMGMSIGVALVLIIQMLKKSPA